MRPDVKIGGKDTEKYRNNQINDSIFSNDFEPQSLRDIEYLY